MTDNSRNLSPAEKAALERYLNTYMQAPGVQPAEQARTDQQLHAYSRSVIELLAYCEEPLTILDIGCGQGTLLDRLFHDSAPFRAGKHLYVGVDETENLDHVYRLARDKRCLQHVDLINLHSFYDAWPDTGRAHIVCIRNVLHELTIQQTATLLLHVRRHLTHSDTLLIQDLLWLPEGERNNVCWSLKHLQTCVSQHAFHVVFAIPYESKSGAAWFDLKAHLAFSSTPPVETTSLDIVVAARQSQWADWGNAESSENAEFRRSLARIVDIDLQFAALTRQLRDIGQLNALPATTQKRLRRQLINEEIEAFIRRNSLEPSSIVETVRLRERGEQLNQLEAFLRGEEHFAFIHGGSGTGKTTLATHLLVTRSYNKIPILIQAASGTDIWAFLEQLFSAVGLRLSAEALSTLDTLTWQHVDVSYRQFLNAFAARLIVVIDNFNSYLDSNGEIEDEAVLRALSILCSSQNSKVIIIKRGRSVPYRFLKELGAMNPQMIPVGRFYSDRTVENILDDSFDRSVSGIGSYPERLVRAIDRHPLATNLAARTLRARGAQVLGQDEFLRELQEKLFRELWSRLVDEQSRPALEVATQVRIPVPRFAICELVEESAFDAAIDSGALYLLPDRRWNDLASIIGALRTRHISSPEIDEPQSDSSLHRRLADVLLRVYQKDDNPQWLRESYYHRMLGTDRLQRSHLGVFYKRELIASANYCFEIQRDYRAALELYDAAQRISELTESGLMHRASCLVRVVGIEEGRRKFYELFKKYPKNIGLKTSFIDALLFLRDYSTAKREMEKLRLEANDSDWIAGQWGRVWMGLHQYVYAEACFRKQLDWTRRPNQLVYRNLARSQQHQGDVREAINTLKKGLEVHPDSISLKVSLGAMLERARDNEGALAILEPIFEARPDKIEAAIAIVKVRAKQGEPVAARQAFDKAKRNAPEWGGDMLVSMEAEVLKSEDRAEAAIELLERHISEEPHILGMLLECYYHLAKAQTDQSEKAEVAQRGLNIKISALLESNVPLMVNRARLAILAGQDDLVSELIRNLEGSRIDPVEVDAIRQVQSNV